jgi:HD-like signal output (HDOD) protein
MGKLVLQLHLTPEYLEVFVHIKESPMHILNAEEAVLGVSHSDVGAWLAKHWKLPQDIINSIEYHHKPSLSPNPISPSVIQVSDILARGLEIGSGGDPFIPACDAFVWETLSLSEVSIEEILKHSSSEIENASVFMSIL